MSQGEQTVLGSYGDDHRDHSHDRVQHRQHDADDRESVAGLHRPFDLAALEFLHVVARAYRRVGCQLIVLGNENFVRRGSEVINLSHHACNLAAARAHDSRGGPRPRTPQQPLMWLLFTHRAVRFRAAAVQLHQRGGPGPRPARHLAPRMCGFPSPYLKPSTLGGAPDGP